MDENYCFADILKINAVMAHPYPNPFTIMEIPQQYQRKCFSLFSQQLWTRDDKQDALTIERFILHSHFQNKIEKNNKSMEELIPYLNRIVKRISLGKKIKKKKPQVYPVKYQSKLVLSKAILSLHEQNFSLETIAAYLKYPKTLIYQFLRHSKEFGPLEKHFAFQKEHEIWVLQTIQQLESYLLYGSQHVHNMFLKQFNSNAKELSLSVFTKFMRRIRISYKQFPLKSLQSLKQTTSNNIQEYCLQWATLKNNGYSLLYLDEKTFGRSQSNFKGWQIANTNNKYRQFVKIHECVNVFGCLGDKSFIRYQIVFGTGNKFIFGSFLNSIIIEAQNHFKDIKFCIIMDNCPIHRAKLIVQEITKNINILFLPPYSPQFNPIENIWGVIKQSVIKSEPRTNSALQHSIKKALTSMKPFCIQRTINDQFKLVLEQLLRK